ncbi:phosphatase [Fusarium heterosporum]|uniref:inosine/xanthosine triphosphatase n=1 Tax=Fusarium heterosporum TaxID=42747 RepID=A0A8H5STV2_FUSHE|nr:phosphatase [Fusarium heterosporum]
MESIQKIVVVASNNIPKIKATREGFTQMLPGSYDFQGVSVDSNVSDQPFSDEETLTGATNRAQNAQKAKPEADFWVGIEGRRIASWLYLLVCVDRHHW